ncbi:MAG: phosphate ABC transporter permease PstA [Chitinophagaceae bacterium]
MNKPILNITGWTLLLGSTLLIVVLECFILVNLFSKGLPVISPEFLLSTPKNGLTEGGILPAITGTLMVTIIAALFSIPFGICCAIYLNEYASASRTTDWIRASIRNLAGIPSIIYGLFGLALFVQLMRFGTSALAAGLTLGLLSLPYIITTTEEALKRVPNALREATLALGATQYESIRDFIIPTAMPGIITGVILTISRVAGETAPILFTGAVFYITGVPTGIRQEFMALPYHLYMLSTQHQDIEKVRPLAYGTVTILILLVISLNLIAFIIRNKYRQYGK